MDEGKYDGVVPGLGISPKVAHEAAMQRKALLEAMEKKASGATLAAVAASPRLTFKNLLDAGLPGQDRVVELAMLYRSDCPAEFLRSSRFHFEVLRDPALSVYVARRVLTAAPSAVEVSVLSRRKDLSSKEVQLAAVQGYGRAGNAGGRAQYAALACLPGGWVRLQADGLDSEIVGLLRNPNCPEDIVRRNLTHGTARVRRFALRAVEGRGLSFPTVLIRAARDLPMDDTPKYPSREAVIALANRIIDKQTEETP